MSIKNYSSKMYWGIVTISLFLLLYTLYVGVYFRDKKIVKIWKAHHTGKPLLIRVYI
jgi:formate-dependent nitrite reductase membrane component NrfD